MIISKLQNAQNKQKEALVVLQESISTEAGSAEARQDAALRRSLSEQTGICPYCDSAIERRSSRHAEACHTCGRVLDSMLMAKSKLLRGEYTLEMLKKMLRFYKTKHDFPYALRGRSVADIVLCLDNLIEAEERLRSIKREMFKEETLKNIEADRKQKLREEYLRFKPDLTTEELEEIVESQYVQRYYRDIV